MEADVGTERLRDRQPESGEWVSRSRQVEVGKEARYATIIDTGTWAGRRRWLAVARPKREAGRQK
jgi:hypothetical protein